MESGRSAVADAGAPSDPAAVRGMFASIAGRYDLANHLLSGGMDFLWRRRVAQVVAGWNPERVLDVATGSGDLAVALKRYTGAEVTGTDFCEEMLERAGMKGVAPLVLADAMALPFADGAFDAVTVAFGLRNMPDYAAALREMARVVRVGGGVVVLDFSLPRPPWCGLYRWYLHKVLPGIAGVITGEKDAYEYLGGSIERFPSGREMLALFERAGLEGAAQKPLTLGVVSVYTGTKRS